MGLGNTIESPYKRRRCEGGSSVAVPQLGPPKAEECVDISTLASTSRQRHYVSSSSAPAEQQREECAVTVSVLETPKIDKTLKLEVKKSPTEHQPNPRVAASTARENSAIQTLAKKSPTGQPNPRVDASTASESSDIETLKKKNPTEQQPNSRVDASTASENSAIETLKKKSPTEQKPNPRLDASTARENSAIRTLAKKSPTGQPNPRVDASTASESSDIETLKKKNPTEQQPNSRVDASTASENSAIETLKKKNPTEQQPNSRVDASTENENSAIETRTPLETDLDESTLKPEEQSFDCGVQILAADSEGSLDDSEHGEQMAATSNSQEFVEDLPESEMKEQELQLISARQSREKKRTSRDERGCFLM
ncbi:uncharacterized protein LOC135439018 [Drosophila montana]|uniref:uncharacterized protein LOC135439018 n=1 Tax=Drosophila montana TaxID=40370 RepID=UPI00313ADE49